MTTPDIPRRHIEKIPASDDPLALVQQALLAPSFLPEVAQDALAQARTFVEHQEQGVAHEFRASLLPEIAPYLPDRLVARLDSAARAGAPLSLELIDGFDEGLTHVLDRIHHAQHRAGALYSPAFSPEHRAQIDGAFAAAAAHGVPVDIQGWTAPQASLFYADDRADIAMQIAPDQQAWIGLSGPAYINQCIADFMPASPPMPLLAPAPAFAPVRTESMQVQREAPSAQAVGNEYCAARDAAQKLRSMVDAAHSSVPSDTSDIAIVRKENSLVRLLKEVGGGLKTLLFGAGGGIASVLASIKAWFVGAQKKAEAYTKSRNEELEIRRDLDTDESDDAKQPDASQDSSINNIDPLPAHLSFEDFKNGFLFQGELIKLDPDAKSMQVGSKKWILHSSLIQNVSLNEMSWDNEKLSVEVRVTVALFTRNIQYDFSQEEVLKFFKLMKENNTDIPLEIPLLGGTTISLGTLKLQQ